MMCWHFYSLSTGLFDGRTFSAADDRFLAMNTPAGFGAIAGVVDFQAQRVNLASGAIVDYQPPAPSSDYEWVGRRWVMKQHIAERDARVTQILGELRALDEKLIRPLGELALDPDDSNARTAAARIKSDKEKLRGELQELRT